MKLKLCQPNNKLFIFDMLAYLQQNFHRRVLSIRVFFSETHFAQMITINFKLSGNLNT